MLCTNSTHSHKAMPASYMLSLECKDVSWLILIEKTKLKKDLVIRVERPLKRSILKKVLQLTTHKFLYNYNPSENELYLTF